MDNNTTSNDNKDLLAVMAYNLTKAKDQELFINNTCASILRAKAEARAAEIINQEKG